VVAAILLKPNVSATPVVPQQGRLDDVRIDHARIRVDAILGAIEVVEKTLLVEITDVVRPEPAAGKKCRVRFIGQVPILWTLRFAPRFRRPAPA
jgi:hypothetical protein